MIPRQLSPAGFLCYIVTRWLSTQKISDNDGVIILNNLLFTQK
jgi:hypothetical protein